MGFFKEGVNEKIVVGLIMLIIVAAIFIFTEQENKAENSLKQAAPAAAVSGESSEIFALEKNLEDKIAASLEKMQGVGKVKVLVNYDSGVRKEYARDESITRRNSKETDKEGGTRETVEVTENNRLVIAGNTEALVVVEERPQVTGVLVIAEGANDPKVKENIFEAVKTLLNIQPTRINVAPMGGVTGV